MKAILVVTAIQPAFTAQSRKQCHLFFPSCHRVLAVLCFGGVAVGLDFSGCGSEHLCGGNSPGCFPAWACPVSLDLCVAFSPVLFSSSVSTFGDISCCMLVWQLMESRSHDFLRRSSQQCSAVHITAFVKVHDFSGAVDECMRSFGEFIVVFKCQFKSPVVSA